jgi:glutamine---fructose-6-phosphate transaminase (isomerizing)
MCGIFAYYGKNKMAAEIVLKGLKKLEYRGYDSWGIAAKQEDGSINVEKHIGKISEVISLSDELTGNSQLALGHSRWATHGGVTQFNAHPHTNEDGSIVIAHNGIFENYLEIKQELIEKGHQFRSETDSEVFAHLISDNMDEGFEVAFRRAIKRLNGRYGVLAMCKDENKLIAARRGSPLIIGQGEDSYFIASDVPAFLEYTKDIIYLDDEQMVIIDDDGANFFSLETNKSIEKRVISIDWEVEEAEKGDYPHFMIKEIMEQKETLTRVINTSSTLLNEVADLIKKSDRAYIIGCGTSSYVAHIGEYLFGQVANKEVIMKASSEFELSARFLTEQSVVIAISQSGETADTLEALSLAEKAGAKIITVVNVETSTMARLSDKVVPIKVGPEKAVASTKATTAQIAIVTLLAFAAADRLDEGRQELIQTTATINDMLNPRYEDHITEIAKQIQDSQDIMVIGRGPSFPVAMEAAMKLKEVTYIHTEGFAGGELKHGPIALIEDGVPSIIIAPNDHFKSEILSNAMELKARGALIIGVSPENAEVFDLWIKTPVAEHADPITHIIPLQLLAYKLAVLRQHNPDMPRNLAKSVTVK